MRRLVVGIDGAASSHHALLWAAGIAGPAGHVHALTATDPEPHLDPPLADAAPFQVALERELEGAWTAAARDLVGNLTTEVVDGAAPDALSSAAAAGGYDAIVVGSHVSAIGVPRRLGRTIRQLLIELPCPLIVVPTSIDHEGRPDRPLVVGVGHGDATDAAVRWAANEACEHDRALGLVRATREGPVFDVDGMLDFVAYYIDPSKRDEWVVEDLAELAAVAQSASDEEIPIATTVASGLPGTTLVAQSHDASLLVIGQHRSKLLGEHHVTQPLRHALTHARCPVAVVPVPDPADPNTE